MKNLRKKGKKIHPSLTPEPLLSLLPASVLTLAAVLSPQDKEVLAYLISCCGTAGTASPPINLRANDHGGEDGGGGDDHAPSFGCNCFRCYMSFWARWDVSPNRQVIHEIIEAYEEWLFQKNKNVKKSGSMKKKKRGNYTNNHDDYGDRNRRRFEEEETKKDEFAGEPESAEHGGGKTGENYEEDEQDKGTVRKIVGFIGEKIWGGWSKN